MPRSLLVVVLQLPFLVGGVLNAQSSVEEDKAVESSEQDSSITDNLEKADREDYYELLMVFADTIDQIERNYVEKISRRELVEAAIEGALNALDPYSNYIAPDELDRFKVEVENEFGGIGIRVDGRRRGQLRVISPLVGTPAYRGGILAGDLIRAIDGKPMREMSLDDAIRSMKGRAGTSVTLTIYHPYTNETEDIELTREVVKVATILGDQRQDDDSWQFMYDTDAKIAYVRITAFGRDSNDELRAVLKSLSEDGMRGLIVDLRWNPGGLLKTAIEVSDMFLSSGTIVSTEGRNVRRQVWEATSEKTENVPLVVLVNQFSASASEIVAAALQDHDRAIIIGQQTFGKASVQNVVELEEGRSALKLTTGSYQRPNGKTIHRFPGAKEWGVRPNEGFEVKMTERQIGNFILQRRKRDIVPNRQAEKTTDDREEPMDDPQLSRALAHLRSELAVDSGAAGQ